MHPCTARHCGLALVSCLRTVSALVGEILSVPLIARFSGYTLRRIALKQPFAQ